MTEATEAELQQIYDDAGRPGGQAFRFAVKRAGYSIADKDAKAFVGKQAVGKIFRGRQGMPSDGNIPGSRSVRFQLDLIDMSKRIEKLKTQRFALVAVDIADRTVYTAAQKSKTAEEDAASLQGNHQGERTYFAQGDYNRSWTGIRSP